MHKLCARADVRGALRLLDDLVVSLLQRDREAHGLALAREPRSVIGFTKERDRLEGKRIVIEGDAHSLFIMKEQRRDIAHIFNRVPPAKTSKIAHRIAQMTDFNVENARHFWTIGKKLATIARQE